MLSFEESKQAIMDLWLNPDPNLKSLPIFWPVGKELLEGFDTVFKNHIKEKGFKINRGLLEEMRETFDPKYTLPLSLREDLSLIQLFDKRLKDKDVKDVILIKARRAGSRKLQLELPTSFHDLNSYVNNRLKDIEKIKKYKFIQALKKD